jgi:hypothetical protein
LQYSPDTKAVNNRVNNLQRRRNTFSFEKIYHSCIAITSNKWPPHLAKLPATYQMYYFFANHIKCILTHWYRKICSRLNNRPHYTRKTTLEEQMLNCLVLVTKAAVHITTCQLSLAKLTLVRITPLWKIPKKYFSFYWSFEFSYIVFS